jgi:hypothetical protein
MPGTGGVDEPVTVAVASLDAVPMPQAFLARTRM